MRFEVAKRKYENGRIQNPAMGRSLGNYTYLYKVNDNRYEIRKPWHRYEENPNYVEGTPGSHRYIQISDTVPILSIERGEGGYTNLEILFAEKYHNQTVANVLHKHVPSMSAFICNHEMRFWFHGSNLGRGRNAPVAAKGLRFKVDERNYMTLSLDEGQAVTTDKRFVNREKAKPINARLKQLNKLGTVLTKLEAVTKADVNRVIDARHNNNKTVLDKLFDTTEFETDDVYRTLASTLGYWERSESSPDPIKNQYKRFQNAMATLRKQAYKRAGVLEAKEIANGLTTN